LGSFAPEGSELKWENCRENFSKTFPATKGFFFSHEPDQGERIAVFLDKVEAVLSLKDRTEYARTNLNFVLWISPSSFWRSCSMRRSLFTILLRAGIKYNPQEDNFQEALLSQSYIVSTKNAVYRFLFGFTKFRGHQSIGIGIGKGWAYHFRNKTDDFVCSQLISTRKKSAIGGTLWT
jgi:hypothetical protein